MSSETLEYTGVLVPAIAALGLPLHILNSSQFIPSEFPWDAFLHGLATASKLQAVDEVVSDRAPRGFLDERNGPRVDAVLQVFFTLRAVDVIFAETEAGVEGEVDAKAAGRSLTRENEEADRVCMRERLAGCDARVVLSFPRPYPAGKYGV